MSKKPEHKKSEKSQDFLSSSPWFYMFVGAGLFFGLYWAMYQRIPTSSNITATLDRIFFVLRWQGLSAVFLFVMVVRLSFLQMSNIMVSALNKDMVDLIEKKLQVNSQVMIDSLIHTTIFFIGSLSFAVFAAEADFQLMPIAVILFFIGRVIYLVGYQIHPKYRSLSLPFTFAIHFYMITKIIENFFESGLY